MNSEKKAVLLIGFAIAGAVLVLVYWNDLGAYLFNPIAILLWQTWQILNRVDQAVYWAILILVCLVFLLRLLPIREEPRPKLAYRDSPKPPNRMEYWATLFCEANNGDNEKAYLRSNLLELFMKFASQVDGANQADLDQWIEEEQHTLPEEARQYLIPLDWKNGKPTSADVPSRWTHWKPRRNNHSDDQGLTELLAWMERELEINDEG